MRGIIRECESEMLIILFSFSTGNVIEYFTVHFQKLNEAAELYEMAGNVNQAASCYIRLKNWTKVGTFLQRVTSSKIHSQFAKVIKFVVRLPTYWSYKLVILKLYN